MKRISLCFVPLFIASCATSLTSTPSATTSVEQQANPASSGADEAAIRSLGAAYTAAVSAGDFQRVLSFYTHDVVVMPPGQPSIRGKKAYTVWAEPYFDQFSTEETILFDEIRVAGGWAVATYAWTLSSTPKVGGPSNQSQGKAIGLLQRSADGSWKWSHVIWNMDHRLAPPFKTP